MNKKLILLALSVLFFDPMHAWAQPSEELPVITVQEMSEEEKRLFLPDDDSTVEVMDAQSPIDTSNRSVQEMPVAADNTLNTSASPAPITVGGGVVDVVPPKDAIKEVPVEGAINGLNFGAGADVTPLGFGTIGGQRRNYFSIKPKLNFGTKLVTGTKKTMDMTVAYSFTWQEFLEKADNVGRGFTNVVDLGFSGTLNDQWSYSFGAYGEWYNLSGPDTASDNYLIVLSSPTMNMKINEKVSLGLTYYIDYLQILNADVSLIDALGGSFDADDYGGGLFSDAVFGANIGDDSLGDLGLSNPAFDLAWIENKLGFTASWAPIEGTSVALNYRYAFLVYSNNPNSEWKGHFIRPKVSQVLPWWDGGKVSYEMRIRQRTFDHALVGDQFKADRRIRNILSFSQKINDSLSASMMYRIAVNSSNKDNYLSRTVQGDMFTTGISYTF